MTLMIDKNQTTTSCLWSPCRSGTQRSSPLQGNKRLNLQIKVQFCRVLVPGGWDDAPEAAQDSISCSSLIGHRRILFFHWLAAKAAVDRGVWLDRKIWMRWVWLRFESELIYSNKTLFIRYAAVELPSRLFMSLENKNVLKSV